MVKKGDTANWFLASQKEQLSRDVPSATILSILDDLLYSSFSPLYSQTTLFRRLLMQVVVYVTEDNRRRVSLVEKNKFNAWLLKASYDNSFEFFTRGKLDRNIYVDLIMKCLELLEPIETIEKGLFGKQRLLFLEERRKLALLFGADEDQLYPLYNWVSGYIKAYLKFKEMIMSRYYRLAYHESNKVYHSQSKRIDTADLYKNLILSTLRAIDKCDATQGTLTSFIQRSYLNAKTYPEYGHLYQVAYDVPTSARHILKKKGIEAENQSVSWENPNVQEKVESKLIDEINISTTVDNNLMTFIRSVPGIEIGLLMLGMPIPLTEREKYRLRGNTTS
jgi:hypothetical protein